MKYIKLLLAYILVSYPFCSWFSSNVVVHPATVSEIGINLGVLVAIATHFNSHGLVCEQHVQLFLIIGTQKGNICSSSHALLSLLVKTNNNRCVNSHSKTTH